ncbi:MAG: LysR family transcriptional regulator [Clostridia bacterium]|nr:LysR family transcriptional regulator [Clostridia bacterium]
MNTKQFRYVLVLAAEGSFSGAAAQLGISQPSLSQYLKKIEKEIGAALFDRSSSELRLTDAGKVYIDAGRKILDIERQLEGRIDDINNYRYGSFAVGISPYRAVCLMPQVLLRFAKLYPGLHLIIEERSGSDLLEGAEHGDYALCITTAPVNERLFCQEKVMDEEVVLAVPATMPMEGTKMKGRKYPAVDVKCLDGAAMITLSRGQIMQQNLENVCARYGLHYDNAVNCRSIEAQLAMVRAGLGIALVPSGIGQSSDSSIRFYSIRQPLPRRSIAAVWRREQYLPRPLQDLIKVFKSFEGGEREDPSGTKQSDPTH